MPNDSSILSVAPTTTSEQDLVTASQRRVNLIWETTQAIIAVLITAAVIGTSAFHVESPQLTNAFFLVVGFYFSRTNHSNTGGVGPKPALSQVYEGR